MKVACNCPLTTSMTAWPAPLYGTWIIFAPVIDRKSSITRWLGEPSPAEA